MFFEFGVVNTHIVLGFLGGSSFRHRGGVTPRHDTTTDELAGLLFGLFNMADVKLTDISDVIIASVVPPLQPALNSYCRSYLGKTPLVVSNAMHTDMRILIDYPEEVGADRIVNAIAGYERYKTALIVVDFGTAITFDCVSVSGDYLGGIIAPGIAISLEALGSRTAKLPRVDISTTPPGVIGKNTVEAIKSGILFGYGSLVDGLVKKIANSMLPFQPKVIATGGMANLIQPYADTIEEVHPLLTLEGLYLLYEKNHEC